MATRRRYTQRTDALGRAYVVDTRTGKRAKASAYDRETKTRARAREKERKALERRERAQRAADTRKRNAQRKKRSDAQKRYWSSEPGRTRRLEQTRKRHPFLGGLHGRDRRDMIALRSLIERGDANWLAFLAKGTELGLSPKAVRDSFFSPKVVKAA
jgi:hypothetical protein